jgi:membrane protease YdiL (CAAX protease family)
MLLMYALAAFAEELVYRGYLVTRLNRLFRSPAAVVCSAKLFGLMHGSLPAVCLTVLVGIFYGIFFLCVPRIWPIAISHLLYNLATEFKVMP